MKISLILCLILFVSCGKVKIGQMEKKGGLPEGSINQPQRAGGAISGDELIAAKRICTMLNQKDFNFKSKYKGKTFTFNLAYKDCNNNNFNSTPSGMLDLEGSNLVYLSGAGSDFYRYEDSGSSPNFKIFCDNLQTSPTDVVVLGPTTRLLYTISSNKITIDEGQKGTNGYTTKHLTSFELAGSGDFVGMILSRNKTGICSSNNGVQYSQTQSVTATP